MEKTPLIKRLFIVSLMSIMFAYAYAQDITLYGEVRPRAEYRDGYGKPIITSNKAGFFVNQRTRLGASFSNDIIKMQVTFQDSRTWGEAASNADNPSVGLYEAWGEIKMLPGLIARVGRMPLRYDERKLFSPSNWSNTGNAFDMLLFKYNLKNDFMVDLGFSYSNNKDISQETYYDPVMKYRYMEILWLSKKISDELNVSAIGVAISNQDTITCKGRSNYKEHKHYHQFTVGGTLKYNPKSIPLKLYFEGYYQFGKIIYKDCLDKQKSFYLVGNGIYTFIPQLAISGGYEYISGDKNPDNHIQRGFIHLFRGNHDFNGTMDYWNATNNRGLQDLYGGLLATFNKKRTSIELIYHHFRTAVDVAGLNGKSLGSELDFIVKHTANEWLSLEAGYDLYFVNENVRIIKGVGGENTRFANWGYVSLSIKPSIAFNNIGKKKKSL